MIWVCGVFEWHINLDSVEATLLAIVIILCINYKYQVYGVTVRLVAVNEEQPRTIWFSP